MRARARANSAQRDRVQEVAGRARRLAGAGARVRALEHDAELERGEHRVPVDRRHVARRHLGVARARAPSGSASRRHRPVAPSARIAKPSRSGQVAISQPRSSSGSPIVHISQSTIAASRGPSLREQQVREVVVAVEDAGRELRRADCARASPRPRRARDLRARVALVARVGLELREPARRPGARGSPRAGRGRRGRAPTWSRLPSRRDRLRPRSSPIARRIAGSPACERAAGRSSG